MKPVRIVDITPPRRAAGRVPIAGPILATLAIAGAAVAAAAFVTIFLLLAGFALAAVLVWRISGWLPGRRRPATTRTSAPGPDRRAYDAFLAARAEAARRAGKTDPRV